VEKVPSYKLEMAVRSVKKRKYEVLVENEEIDEIPTAKDAIVGNFTHGDSALDDNDEYEPREHQTSLDDVPQLTTQVQTSHHTVEEEDAKMTSRPHNMDLETEQITQPTTQPPVEQWPTEAPEISKTKVNRSLEGQDETNQNTPDDTNKGINLTKEKIGRWEK
jgi:hypothetical protein